MHNNVKRDKAYEDEENAIAQKKKKSLSVINVLLLQGAICSPSIYGR
jgi:hypothetical protein